MNPVVYRSKASPLARRERTWRVEEDALIRVGGSGRERRIPWRDVVSVRLCREPQRRRPWRHVFALQCKDGGKIEIDNVHCSGGGVREDRSEDFSQFVRASLARVAVANPKARALIGETGKRYFLLLAGSLIALAALTIGLTLAPTPLDALPYANLLKLGIMLGAAAIFWRWVIGAMPRGVALDAMPEHAFPRLPACASDENESK